MNRNERMMTDLLEAREARGYHIRLSLNDGRIMEGLYFGKVTTDSVTVYDTQNGIGYYGNTKREVSFNSIRSIGYYDRGVRWAILKDAFEKIVTYP